MKIIIQRDQLQEKISSASRFTSNKLSSSTALQGILLKGDTEKVHIYSTNLSAYFHTSFPQVSEEEFEVVIEPKKVLEFLQFLNPGKIEVEVKEKQVTISQEKTKGNFPIMVTEEFPMPPAIQEKEQRIESSFLTKHLPLVLFTASTDEARPVLTGVNFVSSDEELLIVATDGFRLSIIKEKSKGQIPSMIIPADFLQEILRSIKEVKEVGFAFSHEEKIVRFKIEDDEFYSRLIEGEFPPFERVIPTETKTKVSLDKAEFLRNIKLISVFARDYSNVVVCEFKQDGLTVRPKKENSEENRAFEEITIDGEDQSVAFNFKYVMDFLNHMEGKNINVEILRSEAPVVFKMKENPAFLHIIMPVRIQE